MNYDLTQQQSLGGLEKAERLSLQSTAPPSELPGYRMERLLGQGAFGQVWLAEDLNTGRRVAIKFYINRSGVNWQTINREVKHLVSMSTGRHIVQVLHVGWEATPPYYVMEYLESGSLEDLLRAQGALSVEEAAKMFHDIAEGLAFAHSKAVLHCDLKPANVMLDHECRPRLADFGQSRMTNDQTPSLGTLFFMAPEQADLEAQPDAAWDVYALGAIAYCMLVGSPPYRTPEVVETLDTADSLDDRLKRYRETIRHARRPRLHYRRRGIDKGLCQIIDRCLASHPADRYSGIQQVLEALESRARARSRLPLYILGVVGPLLLLPLMLLFSAKSIGVAQQQTIQEMRQLYIQTNKQSCLFAAQGLESEIGALFDLVEDEAREAVLLERLQAIVQQNQPILNQLASAGLDPQLRRQLTAELESSSSQQALQEYIAQRLRSIIYTDVDSSDMFNSVFVNDSRGTNIATFFPQPEDQSATSPVGRNFAWRSYFNGQRSDARDRNPASFTPTRNTHLSAHFQSTSTGKWKVGISAPIWPSRQSDAALADQEPIGVLVLTINLGNFRLLTGAENSGVSESDSSREQFACLVDGRDGNGRGTLIQHPFLSAREEAGQISAVPQIDERFLDSLTSRDGIVNYIDPSSKAEGGEAYQGEWIAALQPVHLPRKTLPGADRNQQRGTSDLWVLVQQRSSTISDPIDKLGSRLRSETYIEFAVLLAVMLILWFFVYRMGRANAFGGFAGRNLDSLDSAYVSAQESNI